MDKKSIIVIAIIIAIWTISYAYQYNQSSQKSYDIVISETGIAFTNAEGKPLVVIMMTKDGGGQLGIINKRGKPLVLLTADDERGAVGVLNNGKKLQASMAADNEGGIMAIYDSDGEPIWAKP
jgi:hypothetical protein